MNTDDSTISPTRRRFFRNVTLIPVAVTALPACTEKPAPATSQARPGETSKAYRAAFFTPAEWDFVVAAVDHFIPSDAEGPGAVELGVPEFIDRHMQTPYAAGDIWYMQGPFVEASPLFGYQGRLPLRDILRVGIKAFDDHCRSQFGGRTFAGLDHPQREQLLKEAEGGKLKFADISAKTFFDQLLTETRTGYFADPKYGGNKDMGAWTAIGYPGARADYLDWVEVRDKPYPLPAVDLNGNRAPIRAKA